MARAERRVRASERSRPRLDQPYEPPRRIRPPAYDPEAFGRISERIARFLGTGRFLVIQSGFIVLWVVVNVIPATTFDPYTFTFLTLILSLQAAYAAPLILLAQNRQDDRDRANLQQDRAESARAIADTEYLTREIASLRIAMGEVATRDFLRAELRDLVEELGAGPDAPREDPAADRKPARKRKRPKDLAAPRAPEPATLAQALETGGEHVVDDVPNQALPTR